MISDYEQKLIWEFSSRISLFDTPPERSASSFFAPVYGAEGSTPHEFRFISFFFFEVGLNIRLLAGQLVIQFCHFRVDVILAFEHSEKLVGTVD